MLVYMTGKMFLEHPNAMISLDRDKNRREMSNRYNKKKEIEREMISKWVLEMNKCLKIIIDNTAKI